MTTANSKLEWALWAIQRGFSVFPLAWTDDAGVCSCGNADCRSRGKHPLLGSRGFKEASDEGDTTRHRWSLYPDANIGIATGGGLVVIDLDVKNGKNGIRELCDRLGVAEAELLAETIAVSTPTGGLHFYYKSGAGYASGVGVLPGIDVRAAGGYVVGPGSVIGNRAYRLKSDVVLAELREDLSWILGSPRPWEPTALLPSPIVWDQPTALESGRAYIQHRVPAEEGNGGDTWTYKTACTLRDRGISQDAAFELLTAPYRLAKEDTAKSWNERCSPPWSHSELQRKIENAYRYARGCAGSFGTGALLDSGDAADPTGEEPPEAPPSHRFRPKNESEQDQEPDVEWLVPGVLPQEALVLFYGPENSFKSFIALDLMLSAAAGQPWAGDDSDSMHRAFPIAKALTTLYIAGEGARGIEKQRRPAWRKHYGITRPLPFYTIGDMPRFACHEEMDALISSIESAGIRPDIIVVDTAARAMLGLDENSAKDSSMFVASCDRLKRHFGATILVVHHSGKDGSKGARGSSNLPASFDTRFLVRAHGTARTVSITNEKQKDAEAWAEPIWFEGRTVIFGATGKDHSSLVFRRIAPRATQSELEAEKRIRAVEEALRRCGALTQAIPTKVLATAIIDLEIERGDIDATKMDELARATMIRSECRHLQRQAKPTNGGKPGVLRRFIASDPVHENFLWILRDEDAE